MFPTCLPLHGATTPPQVSPTTTRNTAPAAPSPARKRYLNSDLVMNVCKYFSSATACSRANTPVEEKRTIV